jgi:hypothetical protein
MDKQTTKLIMKNRLQSLSGLSDQIPSLQSIRASTTTSGDDHLIDSPTDQERPPRWKNHPAEEWVYISVVSNASTSSLAHALALSALTHVCLLVSMVTMVTIGGDLQPGCLADRLLTGLGQPQINP